MEDHKIKEIVKEKYASVAKQESSCCGPVSSCCGSLEVEDQAKKIGYSEEELQQVVEGANLGLGCGNPVALASLKEGETVLDLGSGAGIDCFLASKKVGETGRVIGVDMTQEMIDKARENALKGNYDNVEFRLAEIEKLPVEDNSVDVIISNCVINLSPEKNKVFRESFRVLKPGGRIMISDIVLLKELPGFIKKSIEAYVGCVAGASLKDDYIAEIKAAGFHDVQVLDEVLFPIESITSDSLVKSIIESIKILPEKIKAIASSVVSVKVYAVKSVGVN